MINWSVTIQSNTVQYMSMIIMRATGSRIDNYGLNNNNINVFV